MHTLHVCGPEPQKALASGWSPGSAHRAADSKLRADGKALFERNREHYVAWKATRICSRTAYETTRKLIGGYHLLENAFWGKCLSDVQLQVCIDVYLYVFICIQLLSSPAEINQEWLVLICIFCIMYVLYCIEFVLIYVCTHCVLT
jgi:hypothetical protein